MKSPETVWASGVSGTFGIGSCAERTLRRIVASLSPATGPAFHATSRARTASMHWPNVAARTATPVLDLRDVGDARHRLDLGLVAYATGRAVERGRPAHHRRQRVGDGEVGGELLLAGDGGRASTRLVGVPMTLNSASVFSSTSTGAGPGAGRGLDGELAVGDRASRCGAGDHATLGDEPGDGVAEHDRGSVEQRDARDRGGDPDRGVRRDRGVGATGELVEEQLGAGRGEGHPHPVDGQVELLGDEHRGRGGDALADLGARQREARGAVLVDRDGDQVARSAARRR